jgi:probable HAF family extracellular repeat protein
MRTRHQKPAGILHYLQSQTTGVVGRRTRTNAVVNSRVHMIRGHRFIAHLSYMGVALLLGWLALSHTSSDIGGTGGTLYTIGLVPSGQFACALNAAGQVAGITNYAAGWDSRPIVWNQDNPTSTTVAPITEDEFCSVCAINNAGEIVGGFNSDVAVVPFVWSSGGVERIPLPSGATGGEASGINQTGDVVGYSSGDNGIRAFVRYKGTDVQELAPLPSDTFSSARGINDSGQVAGTSGNDNTRHAVLWSNTGVVQDLGTLTGDTSSEPSAINTAGEVVGYSEGPGGTRAFLWTSENGMQDLGQLTNSTDSQALAINDSGVVVGTCTVLGESHAFVWTAQAGMQDLNSQILWTPLVGTISADLPIVLLAAHAINNRGQILATAIDRVTPCVDASGACLMAECAPAPKHFFVLTPVLQSTPE